MEIEQDLNDFRQILTKVPRGNYGGMLFIRNDNLL